MKSEIIYEEPVKRPVKEVIVHLSTQEVGWLSYVLRSRSMNGTTSLHANLKQAFIDMEDKL